MLLAKASDAFDKHSADMLRHDLCGLPQNFCLQLLSIKQDNIECGTDGDPMRRSRLCVCICPSDKERDQGCRVTRLAERALESIGARLKAVVIRLRMLE